MWKEAEMTMRKAVIAAISIVMLFAFAPPAEAATWSGPRYRGPFATQPECEEIRSIYESRLDFDPAPFCTYYPAGCPKPNGGMGAAGWYFIFWVRID
jgi:hypothetical protein